MTRTTVEITTGLLVDLKLVKRVLGTKNMTETIRRCMNSANYNKKWLDAMADLLERQEAKKE